MRFTGGKCFLIVLVLTFISVALMACVSTEDNVIDSETFVVKVDDIVSFHDLQLQITGAGMYDMGDVSIKAMTIFPYIAGEDASRPGQILQPEETLDLSPYLVEVKWIKEGSAKIKISLLKTNE